MERDFACRAERAAGLPPLIDREVFFGDPEISQARLSPDGRFLSFLKPLRGVRNIWVKGIDEPMSAARPLTDDARRPIPYFRWTRDGRRILFIQDAGGDENFNLFAVDPGVVPEAGREVPPARNLTNTTDSQVHLYSLPKAEPDLVYVGINNRAPAWHDVYRIRISTGERTLLRENHEQVREWVFDNRGELRLAVRIAESGGTEILRVDGETLTKVYGCGALESCEPVRFDANGRRAYLQTNAGAGQDLKRLSLLDPMSGSEDTVAADPLARVDVGEAIFSERTDGLMGVIYPDDRLRVDWRDGEFAADYRYVEERLRGWELLITSMTADDRLWLIHASGDTEPGQCLLFDRVAKALTLQYRLFENLPREHLVPMRVVRYPSSDGLEIQAYLVLPVTVPARNLPLVVAPHGGPWSRSLWGYHAVAQFLANRGYAVLLPNFRGSTGFGKRFLNAGNGEWGRKMQDDLTWGVRYLVAEGIADARRVAIAGVSYGGYAALAGAAFTPDLYAAAVSVVGPSNLITLLESIPPYWESARRVYYVRMGDLRTPEGRAQLERQSPLRAADRIKTPLLVVQGANDPRVKKAESEQIVKALHQRGFPVEYLLAPNEGHGFAHPVNNLARMVATERFLARHVGGRCQEAVSPEVARRLAEITVDVNTLAPSGGDPGRV